MKRLYDKEYQTQWYEEVKFLKTVGIPYTFVKTKDGISTYKYIKSSELFKQLAVFYGEHVERLTGVIDYANNRTI